jgi:hypothetical protein
MKGAGFYREASFEVNEPRSVQISDKSFLEVH